MSGWDSTKGWMKTRDRRLWKTPANSAGQLYKDVIQEVADALQSRSDVIDVGDIIRLYGMMLKISNDIRVISEIIPKAPSADAKGILLDERDLAVFRRFFENIAELDHTIQKLDVVILDVYHPGLVRSIAEAKVGDLDIYRWFNVSIAPKYHLDTEAIPPTLAHFLWKYDPKSPYTLGYAGIDLADQLSQDIFKQGKQEHWWEARSGEGDYYGRYKLDLPRLRRMCHELEKVAEVVGQLVRDNWSLKELSNVGRLNPEALTVTIGDSFSNIGPGATVVNRSTVNNAFNRVEHEIGQDVALALKKLADVVEQSGSKDAVENFNAFTEELGQPIPRKSLLRSFWEGIVRALPTIAGMTDIAMKVASLFA